MEHREKTKIESAAEIVNQWGQRVLFWADWNLRIVPNDPLYEKILDEVKDIRLIAFNRYLEMIHKDEIITETFELDIQKIIEKIRKISPSSKIQAL